MGFEDFCYAYFGRLGRALYKMSPGIDYDMEAACMQIHPHVYLSMIAFATIISAAASYGAPVSYTHLTLPTNREV